MKSLPAANPFSVSLHEELHRQYRALRQEAPVRLSTAAVAFLVSAAFIPWGFAAFCGLLFFAGDIGVMVLMRGLDPAKTPRRYWACLLCGLLTHFAFVTPAAVIWHSDMEYAKAMAVGMAVSRLIYLVSVAAIHRPFGLSGIVVDLVVVLTSSTVYWININKFAGLVLATMCIIAAFSYAAVALIANNRLHRETFAGRVEAQSANAAKTRFLAQVSHELRTPLNAILGLGHAELALNPTPDSKARMEILVQSAESLTLVLDDILDMSAIQSGAVHIRPAPADPAAAIASVAALYRPMFSAKGLNLILNIGENLPHTALLDPQRLRQCLGNLLSNALKYTQKGEAAIDVGYGADAVLQITVTDTGPGVSPQERELIFAAFHRGLDLQSGTGLGLAISRALARQMGGDLVLQPSTCGARFLLTLKAASLPTAAIKTSSGQPRNLSLAGRQVLVVDDISTNRLVAGTYLRMMGAAVLEARSGDEALQVLQRETVDLVLLDMNMPGLSGVETLARIRGVSGLVAPPVLAMTADATEAHRRGYLAAGLDGYIAKPMSPDSLAAAISPHLGGGGTPH